MNKGLKYFLIVVMILSLLMNFYLLVILGQSEIVWENEITLSNMEWCSMMNNNYDLMNDMLIELKYYNEDYNEYKLLEKYDCNNFLR